MVLLWLTWLSTWPMDWRPESTLQRSDSVSFHLTLSPASCLLSSLCYPLKALCSENSSYLSSPKSSLSSKVLWFVPDLKNAMWENTEGFCRTEGQWARRQMWVLKKQEHTHTCRHTYTKTQHTLTDHVGGGQESDTAPPHLYNPLVQVTRTPHVQLLFLVFNRAEHDRTAGRLWYTEKFKGQRSCGCKTSPNLQASTTVLHFWFSLCWNAVFVAQMTYKRT